MANSDASAIDPYPVRVWMGYGLKQFRSDANGREEFYQRLGSVFIPATVQIMRPLGLTAYLPTVIPADQDAVVPDEIALVFYESRQVYAQACQNSVGGRAYAMLHETVFNFVDSPEAPKSRSGFPELFKGAFDPEYSSSYYLFDLAVDWQQGQTNVLIGVDNVQSSDAFSKELIRALTDLTNHPPPGMDGVVFSVFHGCLVFWSHWAPGVPALLNPLCTLRSLRIVLNVSATETRIPSGFTDDYDGMTVAGGDSFNFQFIRRFEAGLC